jgi:hypothetical protein
MSNPAIAKRFGVTDKTVGKAISWHQGIQFHADD